MIIAAVVYPLIARLYARFNSLRKAYISASFFAVPLALATAWTSAEAQTAHVSGVQSTVYSLPSSVLNAVAVDGSGNIYIADATLKQVLRFTPASGGYTQTIVASATFTPSSIAVDATGNVYIADAQNQQILLETPTGPATYSESIFPTGELTDPEAISIDAAGNIYIADGNRIIVETFASGSYTETILTTATTLSGPRGVAADASGNIFIANTGAGQLLEESPDGECGYNETVLLTGFNGPQRIVVDALGNVYFPDSNNVFKETFVAPQTYTVGTINSSGMSGAITSVALDAAGNFFVADSGNGRIVKESALSGSFGSVPVASASSTAVTVFFTFDTGGSVVSPSVQTQGIPGLDFTDATTGSCSINGTDFVYNPGDTCTVDVKLTPLFPGSRYGSAKLVDGDANLLAAAYVYGTGTGPKVSFPDAAQSHPDTDINGALGIAGDAGGNLFIADTGDNLIYKDTVLSGYAHVTIATDALSTPYGIAVDGAGIVYVADTGNARIFKLVPSAAGYAQVAIATGSLNEPQGIAVDGAGNIYIADTGSSRILKETPTAGSYSESTVTTTPLQNPNGIAVDSDGVIYIADTDNGRVIKETPSGGSYVESIVDPGLSLPTNVAVDGAGNVYVSDNSYNRIYLEVLSAGAYSRLSLRANAAGPQGLALAGLGDLFYVNGTLRRLNIINPASGNFDNTAVGDTSAPSVIAIINTGNTALTFPAPESGNNPSIAPNFLLDSSGGSACPLLSTVSSPATLASGATCTLSISFSPTVAGSISGALVLTDDHLNAPSPAFATQSIPLSGEGTLGTATITFTVAAGHVYGDSFTLSASSASSGAFTYSVVSGPVSISGTTATITGVGPIVIEASQAADANYNAGTQNASFSAAAATPTIAFTVAAGHVYGDSFTLAASSGSSGAFTYSVISGPVSISGTTATITGVGPIVIEASQAADSNYDAASQNASFSAAAATPTITFTVAAGHVYGDSFTLSASSGSSGAFTYSVISGPASITGTTATITGVGPIVIEASQAADSNYNAASQNASFSAAAATPTIAFTVATGHVYGDSFTLSASSGSSGAFTFSVVSGPVSITGTTATITGVGPIVIEASQAADANHTAGTQNASFSAAPATPTITFTVATGHVYGDSFTLSASSGSSGAFTYSVVSGPVSITGTTATITGVGPIVIEASQAADANYNAGTQNASFSAAPATPTISFTVAAGHVYGDSFTLAASSGSSGAFTYSVISGSVSIVGTTATITGVGPIVIEASQAADANYNAVTQNASFSAAAATPVITFTVAAGHVYGDSFTLSASSASGGAFTYSVVSGPVSISGTTATITGVGPIVIEASQAADANYNAGTQNASFSAAAATPTITFTVGDHILGDAPFTVSASSPSEGAITYSVVSGAATILGSTVTLTGTGPVVLKASQDADANFVAASQNASFNAFGRTVWVGNSNASLSAFDVSGTAVSPSNGYTGGGLTNIAPGLGMAFDHSGVLWVANTDGGISAFAADGTPLEPTAFTGGGISNPLSVAVDGAGQVWVANGNGTISVLANSGAAVSPDGGYSGLGLATPGAIAVDLSGNVWVSNTTDDSVTEFIGAAAPAAPLSTAVSNATTGARP